MSSWTNFNFKFKIAYKDHEKKEHKRKNNAFQRLSNLNNLPLRHTHNTKLRLICVAMVLTTIRVYVPYQIGRDWGALLFLNILIAALSAIQCGPLLPPGVCTNSLIVAIMIMM